MREEKRVVCPVCGSHVRIFSADVTGSTRCEVCGCPCSHDLPAIRDDPSTEPEDG